MYRNTLNCGWCHWATFKSFTLGQRNARAFNEAVEKARASLSPIPTAANGGAQHALLWHSGGVQRSAETWFLIFGTAKREYFQPP